MRPCTASNHQAYVGPSYKQMSFRVKTTNFVADVQLKVYIIVYMYLIIFELFVVNMI